MNSLIAKFLIFSSISGTLTSISELRAQDLPVGKAQKQIVCVKKDEFIAKFEQFGESPLLVAEDAGVRVIVWFNEKTKTMTVTESKGDIVCVISMGDRAFLYKGKDV